MTELRNKAIRAVLRTVLIANAIVSAQAQVAITEVMSQPSRSCGAFRGVDYFELTNFGTNAVDLDGYGVHDDHDNEILRQMFAGFTLQPTQTVVFFRTNSAGWNTNLFRSWWGETSLPANLVLRGYNDPGLNGDDGGDELWLRDQDNNVVDVVFFPTATPGHSFVSDPLTGEFGTVSQAGIHGAFAALLCTNDIGSPGRSTGAVPLQIIEEPQDQILPGCGTVTLGVAAQGLPRPHYQWFKDGIPVPGATEPTLVLRDVGQTHQFYAVVNNGLTQIVTRTNTVAIVTDPLSPFVTSAPQDIVVYREQIAVFCAETRGYPCPNYQWQIDGQDLPGETSRCLEWPVPWDEPYGSRTVTLRVFNTEGSTDVSARLTITPRPDLRVTEVMAWPTNEVAFGHADWFELTNFSTNAVDLTGFRFADSESFRAAMTITNRVVIKPGESIVFVDTITPAAFRAWWGADHLRPDLQIITWYGFGLDNGGEEIYFWNAAARHQTNEVLVSASCAKATEGVSFDRFRNSAYDEMFGWWGNAPLLSTNGIDGAFRTQSGDIGSPGYTTNPPPRLVGISRNGPEVTIRARVVLGKTYRLWTTANLVTPSWAQVSSQTATGFFVTFSHGLGLSDSSRFYRLEELP